MIEKSKKLKILAIGPQNVCPPQDGGKEGIFGAISALAKYTDLMYAFPADKSKDYAIYVDAGIQPIGVKFSPRETLGLILFASAKLRPFKFEKYGTYSAARAFAAALRGKEFDVIICHHAHTVLLAERIRELINRNIPIILREHNIEYSLVRSYRQSQNLFLQFFLCPFEWITKREELKIWGRVDGVAMLSDKDLDLAKSSGVKANLFLAREGVPLPDRREIVFPGFYSPLLILLNPKAVQSVANLSHFLRKVWIPVRESGITNPLFITGVDQAQLSKLTGLSGEELKVNSVQGLGFLPELSPIFSKCLALISPTYIGGGIRKKILEAMAHQLPVIATDEDILTCTYFRPGKNILPMSQIEDFKESIGKLRSNELYWKDVSDFSRLTVERYANWDEYAKSILGKLDANLHSIQ